MGTESNTAQACCELTKAVCKNGVFENPWSTWKFPDFSTLFKWRFTSKNNTNLPNNRKELDDTLPVHKVTQEEINEFVRETNGDKIKFIWIGHASCLLNIENCVILVDPVFSQRCSPVQFTGPERFRPLPIDIVSIPRIDAVVISHNHYDHLDYNSVKELHEKFGSSIQWFVGSGLKTWFTSVGINDNVNEMLWWDSKKYKNLEFVFTIAQHWSQRGINDRCKSLWGSWTIVGPKKRFFFAGDTGYCSSFNEIGQKYGPFDLATIPIGAYEPRFMMEPQHVDPEQAVKIHMDIGSKKSIGVHWGTFALANEFYLEPPIKLVEAVKKLNLDKETFITVQHGKVFEF